MENENTTNNEAVVAPVANDSQPSRPVSPTESLIAYLQTHPEETLWEAIRNWSGEDYVFTGNLTNKKGTNIQTTVDSVKIYLTEPR